ncbi:MAG: cytochrome o ubiquinol oxidase subunit IV [Neorhizobium sp.]|nr:cytochrome o ubiquinol oxidase subunit IV [Neorhizobium sp.]
MSTSHHTPAGHGGAEHGNHGSKSSLWIGSILSIVLTVIPFWLAMSGATSAAAISAIFILAMVQIAVHVRYFLHIDSSTEGGWTFLAFIFTAIIVVITIIGSIWVMYHLNLNMMPMSIDEMRQM